mgnify:CR=1 FL=1
MPPLGPGWTRYVEESEKAWLRYLEAEARCFARYQASIARLKRKLEKQEKEEQHGPGEP